MPIAALMGSPSFPHPFWVPSHRERDRLPLLRFVGFFTFFLGKISADTIMQQSMPDDFRGRAFALFDIAYNVGFIVPALILSFLWVEGDASRTRVILMVSGAVFLGLTVLIWRWSRRIRDQFAPQDDLVEVEP